MPANSRLDLIRGLKG